MAQSLFQDPPQAQGYWTTNVSKAAVLFWQWMAGQIAPPSSSNGMVIPQNDTQEFTYFGSTNNVQTITYKLAGTTVATQTFTYVGNGVADDDDVASIVLT